MKSTEQKLLSKKTGFKPNIVLYDEVKKRNVFSCMTKEEAQEFEEEYPEPYNLVPKFVKGYNIKMIGV